jgi:outer membrane protein assembly factor BamC
MSLKFTKVFFSGFILVALIGCESISSQMEEVLPDRKVEYKKSRQAERDLEIPPDLSRSSIRDDYAIPSTAGNGGSATYSDFMNRGTRPGTATAGTMPGSVLPQMDDIEVRRDGDQRWLVIRAQADDVWPKVIGFWQENGILLVEQDPAVGVMVTDWIENRADIDSDFITDTIRSVFDGLYSAATRDQFRIRLERNGDGEVTELFLTHRGMEEQVVSGPGGSGDRNVWVPRETDHGLEAEMLRRLMVYMGVADQKASTTLARRQEAALARSQLIRNRDLVELQINEGFSRAWRLTGVALDRVGFAVEDRDRGEGIYYVRYNDPMRNEEDPGFLSKLAFWRDDSNIDKENRYQVRLRPETEATKLLVLNEQGERENSDTAVRILTLLHEQLK